jgi:hypothetical protein
MRGSAIVSARARSRSVGSHCNALRVRLRHALPPARQRHDGRASPAFCVRNPSRTLALTENPIAICDASHPPLRACSTPQFNGGQASMNCSQLNGLATRFKKGAMSEKGVAPSV